MKLLINIECVFGLDDPTNYLFHICDIIDADYDNAFLIVHYSGSYFWYIDEVDVNVYNDNVDEIYDYVNGLYRKGFIQFFFIGQADEMPYSNSYKLADSNSLVH